ncbi:MAG: hypothetical protein ACYTHM_22965 [Planctomycetota bacterium]|jgi:hypothetical protein
MRGTCLLGLAVLVTVCARAEGVNKGKTLNLEWAKSVDGAKAQAKKGKKPIAICFIQRTCKLSMRMVKALHEDGRVYENAKDFVWICVDPTRREAFKWFIGLCGDSVEGTPTFFFLNHKGEYADPALSGIEPVTGADPDRIVTRIREVLCRFKKKVPDKEKEEVLRCFEEGKKAQGDDPASALRSYRSVIRRGMGWKSLEKPVEQSREAIEKIVQKGMTEVRKLLEQKATPEVLAKALKAVQDAYPATDAAYWAGELLREVKKRKKK